MLKEKIYDHYRKSEHHGPVKHGASDSTVFFNPSSFSACRRQIYYKKTNATPSNPISAASYLKMSFGSVLHEKIQAIIYKQGILIEAEKLKIATFGRLRFRYKTDGIIVLDNKKYIMEIKTTHAGGMRAVRDEPKPSDVIQMCLYMLFEKIDSGILLYVGRDNGFLLEYAIHTGDYLYKKALERILKKMKELTVLELNIMEHNIPGRDCQLQMKNICGKISEKFQKDKKAYRSDWQCEYCQWKDLCWKRELEEMHKHSFFIDGEYIDQ